MKYTFSFAIITCFLLFSSCSKDEELMEIPFESYDNLVNKCDLSIAIVRGIEERSFIAKTPDEYISKTACIANPPEIDFSTHYIIGGSVYFPNCAELKDQNLRLAGNKLVYEVNIKQADCQALATVYFMVAVPIIYNEKEVDFHIEY